MSLTPERRNVFKAEIARLIAERDKWKRDAESLKWRQRALSAEAKRDSLQCVVDSQDWEKAAAENDALNADLAAARAALEIVRESSPSGYLPIVTGEALAAVWEVVDAAGLVVSWFEGQSHQPRDFVARLQTALSRLRAVFGEERDR